MAKKLYVGGIPFALTEDELREAFSKVGAVTSASIVTDKFTGRSRGFGFVEMSSDEEAAQAIATLNGSQLGERTILVSEARPLGDKKDFGTRPPRRSFGGNQGGFGGGQGGSRGGYGSR